MQIIDETTIRATVTVADARAAVHDAFCVFANGRAVAPHELAMALDHGGELHVKGAYLGGDVLAFKAATGQFPGGGNSGFTAVMDATTGAPIAVLEDGGWLTEMRTAAASAVSAAALARPDASTLAILGGGIQAAFQVEALRDAFELESVAVWSRTAATADTFAAAQRARAAATVAEAVRDADIVICCTPSRTPLLEHEMLAPGTHVISMGADMAGKRELAADVLLRADLVVCDSVAVCRDVGELQHHRPGAVEAVDLGDVLTGRSPGRTTPEQITITDLCGLGIQDAAMAELVMSRLPTSARENARHD